MIKYNFVNNYSGLKVWDKSALETTLPDKKSKNQLILEKINATFNVLKNQKSLYIPPLTTLCGYLIINISGLPAYINITRLEPRHYEFQEKVEELKNVQEKIKSQLGEMEKYYGLYSIGAPSFLFAYFIQQSIPSNIQISEYIVDKDGFRIFASSYSMDSLNDMIEAMLTWPIIESDTVSVKNVITQTEITNLSPIDISIVEITGKIKNIGLKEKFKLYKESFNYGHTTKLERYIDLNSLTLQEGL